MHIIITPGSSKQTSCTSSSSKSTVDFLQTWAQCNRGWQVWREVFNRPVWIWALFFLRPWGQRVCTWEPLGAGIVNSSEIVLQVQGCGCTQSSPALHPQLPWYGGRSPQRGFPAPTPPFLSPLLLPPPPPCPTEETAQPALCPDVFSEQDLDPTLPHCPSLSQQLSTAHCTQQVS